jgi:hypothetical protein
MEKKGYTEKIKYDFNTAQGLEVEVDGVFYRTTANDFRSWGGRRRTLNVKDRTNPVYEEYFGPVYYLNTNKIVPHDKIVDKINYLDGYEKIKSRPRSFAEHLVS